MTKLKKIGSTIKAGFFGVINACKDKIKGIFALGPKVILLTILKGIFRIIKAPFGFLKNVFLELTTISCPNVLILGKHTIQIGCISVICALFLQLINIGMEDLLQFILN